MRRPGDVASVGESSVLVAARFVADSSAALLTLEVRDELLGYYIGLVADDYWLLVASLL